MASSEYSQLLIIREMSGGREKEEVGLTRHVGTSICEVCGDVRDI